MKGDAIYKLNDKEFHCQKLFIFSKRRLQWLQKYSAKETQLHCSNEPKKEKGLHFFLTAA
jgi:hypothetical protein